MADAITLEAFAATDRDPRSGRGYLDTLPEEVKTQLIESDAGHAQVIRWLHSLGYTRATRNMVAPWRNQRKAQQ